MKGNGFSTIIERQQEERENSEPSTARQSIIMTNSCNNNATTIALIIWCGVVSVNSFTTKKIQHFHHTTPQLFAVPPQQRRAILSGEGFPSNPGWKKGQLDTLTDWAVNNEANRPIINEYEPDWMWL